MRTQALGNGLLVEHVSEHLFAVLAALQLQGTHPDKLLSLSDAGWKDVLVLSDRLQLTIPLAQRSSERYPAWVNERLEKNLSDVAQRFPLVEATYAEAAVALAHAGVPQIVLKGFTQAPDFVKAPRLRMQGDIDFYTPRNYTQTAVDALRAIGYEPVGSPENYGNCDHPPTLVRFRDWKWRGNRYDPKMPLAIEVHTCLWNAQISLISLPEVDDFWNRRMNRKLGGLSFCSLAPVDHVCYFALHLLRDFLLGDPHIHHAYELATFLHQRADDSVFWAQWEASYSLRLKQMQAIAFALAGAGFSSRIPDAVEEHIRRLPAKQRAWIKICGRDLLVQRFLRTRDGHLLQFLLCDSAKARRHVFWRAISPGEIASPKQFAKRQNLPAEKRTERGWRPWRYSAYLMSRALFHSAAVLRFLKNSVVVFLRTMDNPQEST